MSALPLLLGVLQRLLQLQPGGAVLGCGAAGNDDPVAQLLFGELPVRPAELLRPGLLALLGSGACPCLETGDQLQVLGQLLQRAQRGEGLVQLAGARSEVRVGDRHAGRELPLDGVERGAQASDLFHGPRPAPVSLALVWGPVRAHACTLFPPRTVTMIWTRLPPGDSGPGLTCQPLHTSPRLAIAVRSASVACERALLGTLRMPLRAVPASSASTASCASRISQPAGRSVVMAVIAGPCPSRAPGPPRPAACG